MESKQTETLNLVGLSELSFPKWETCNIMVISCKRCRKYIQIGSSDCPNQAKVAQYFVGNLLPGGLDSPNWFASKQY